MGIHVVRGHGRFTSGERGQMRGRRSFWGPSPFWVEFSSSYTVLCVGLSRIRTTCHHPTPTGYHHHPHPAGLILAERLQPARMPSHLRSITDRRREEWEGHTLHCFFPHPPRFFTLFFRGEAAAAAVSSSSFFPRRHCSSYRDQDIEFALRLQLSHFAPLSLPLSLSPWEFRV